MKTNKKEKKLKTDLSSIFYLHILLLSHFIYLSIRVLNNLKTYNLLNNFNFFIFFL